MKRIALPLLLAAWMGVAGAVARRANADVVVVANRTSAAIAFTATCENKTTKVTLAAGDLVPLRVRGAVEIAYRSSGGVQRYQARPNSACFFAAEKQRGAVRLHEIGLRGGDSGGAMNRPESLPAPEVFSDEGKTIAVKILVDDDQPLLRRHWEPALRKRVAECSDVLYRHCFVRLKVVEVDVWDSQDATTDFSQALREFEREVDPRPAQLAIGFTSQFHVTRGRTNLGGIREPFSRHILIREWRHRASESGRMELLVHELGHYLGACHSPEQISAMRAVLADKQANSVDFRVGYDPVNTLAVNLVAEELMSRDVTKFHQLTPWTKRQLVPIYSELARALPRDPAAPQFLALMNLGQTRRTTVAASDLISGVGHVVAAIVAAAEEDRAAVVAQEGTSSDGPPDGDRLTELYFRRAAGAAAALDDKISTHSFLLGLAVALGSPESLRENPTLAKIVAAIKVDRKQLDAAVLGRPTMHGRADLLKHFVFSAALTATGGARIAESAGFLKEYADAQGESGFSFADLAADFAGIQWATHLRRSPGRLKQLSRSFAVADFVLPDQSLPEGLSLSEFVLEYGSSKDRRYLSQRQSIIVQLQLLPGYADMR